MGKYEEPKLNKNKYTCIYCDTLSQHRWHLKVVDIIGSFDYVARKTLYNLSTSRCECCGGITLWKDDMIIDPISAIAPLPLEEMPEGVKEIYNEARLIVELSPRSACALLRLSIELLCEQLEPTGNLNAKIGKLVNKGLDPRVSKALDIVRITGNDQIHPGKITTSDTKEIAITMFELCNFIVDRMIVQPKNVDELFSSLPSEKIEAIEKRDKQSA